MPKVKTCSTDIDGATFTSALHVASDGQFSITRPGQQDDWPHCNMKITGTEAAIVERRWCEACRDYARRSRTDRKVIIVRYDSVARTGGVRCFFNGKDATLILEARIALERTITQGEQRTVKYMLHPDLEGMHKPQQPFPPAMTLRHSALEHPREDWCVVEWTQELEDTLIRACNGIQAILELFDNILTDPEKLQLASTQQWTALTLHREPS